MEKDLFFGADTPSVTPINERYDKIKDQRHLYRLLADIWCEKTCAPRLRPLWSKDNNTVGQCSITSFLAQDIFGGNVYGVPLPAGGFHCFNEVGGVVFDLTDAQFGGEKLDYSLRYPQSREVHFSDEEKYQRYLLLKQKLETALIKL